jgi:predicted nucleic acid-binding protein
LRYIVGYAPGMTRPVRRGHRCPRLDLQIAATAAAARLTLLTGHPDDFAGLERLVEVVPVGPPARGGSRP